VCVEMLLLLSPTHPLDVACTNWTSEVNVGIQLWVMCIPLLVSLTVLILAMEISDLSSLESSFVIKFVMLKP